MRLLMQLCSATGSNSSDVVRARLYHEWTEVHRTFKMTVAHLNKKIYFKKCLEIELLQYMIYNLAML